MLFIGTELIKYLFNSNTTFKLIKLEVWIILGFFNGFYRVLSLNFQRKRYIWEQQRQTLNIGGSED